MLAQMRRSGPRRSWQSTRIPALMDSIATGSYYTRRAARRSRVVVILLTASATLAAGRRVTDGRPDAESGRRMAGPPGPVRPDRSHRARHPAGRRLPAALQRADQPPGAQDQ